MVQFLDRKDLTLFAALQAHSPRGDRTWTTPATKPTAVYMRSRFSCRQAGKSSDYVGGARIWESVESQGRRLSAR
jgi:hypothetical protein